MSRPRTDEQARFWSHVNKSEEVDGCWEWTGSKNAKGYGRFRLNGGLTMTATHRLAYIWANGPVPAGLVMDHLCENRCCVRPSHLEAVTNKWNVTRSRRSMPFQMAARSHCKNGHAFAAHGYVRPGRAGRVCSACAGQHARAFKERKHLASIGAG